MDLKPMLQIAVGCMEAISFLSVIFKWNMIYDMDLKHMHQIAVGCMEAIGFLSMTIH